MYIKHLYRVFNAQIIKVFVTVVLLVHIGYVSGQTSANTKALLTHLFTTNAYNKDVRPSNDQTQTTLLYIDFNLVSFNSLEEVQQKLTITAFLVMFWIDEHLQWTPASYGGITQLYIPQNKIWKPDIALQNGFQKLQELGSSFILTRVTNDGNVMWMPYEVFETTCNMDISNYPFDQQKCDLKFVVWSYNIAEVNITTGGSEVLLQVTSNGEWDIIGASKNSDLYGSEARVTFSLTFSRKPLYVMLNIVLPVIFLSVLNNAVFMLPADSGEKMGYSVTVFLSFAVFLTIVSASLPETSTSVPLLSLYLLLQLSVGTLTVLITSIQLRLHFREDEIPAGYRYLTKFANLLLCRKNPCKKNKVTVKKENSWVEPSPQKVEKCNDKEEKEEEVTWKKVCSAIDIIMFLFLNLFFILNTIITLSIAYTKGR